MKRASHLFFLIFLVIGNIYAVSLRPTPEYFASFTGAQRTGWFERFRTREGVAGYKFDLAPSIPKDLKLRDGDKALVLSDGLSFDMRSPYKQEPSPNELGRLLARSYPMLEVIRSDRSIGAGRPETDPYFPNITNRIFDNKAVFPFADNEMSLILMRRSLCKCNGSFCSGFDPRSAEGEQFFGEVARVLKKSNPNAVAVLHGELDAFGSIETMEGRQFSEDLERILRRVELRFGVEIEIMHKDPTIPSDDPRFEKQPSIGHVQIIVIKPKPSSN